MNYEEWERSIPEEIVGDALWRVEAYRLALFASDLSWHDVTKLMQDRRTVGLASQLYEAVGSMGANVAEGYSRGSAKDRARFYEYALGSARESRDWYYKARHVLSEPVTTHRLRLPTQVVRLLLTMIPQQRGYTLHEDNTVYQAELDSAPLDANVNNDELLRLLRDVPMP